MDDYLWGLGSSLPEHYQPELRSTTIQTCHEVARRWGYGNRYRNHIAAGAQFPLGASDATPFFIHSLREPYPVLMSDAVEYRQAWPTPRRQTG
jgi:hypothetical protein